MSIAAQAATIANTDEFTFELQGVGSPEMGLMRTATSTTYDFDATDFNLFTEYKAYTNKFDFYSYDSASKAYTGRSYGNLNAGYLGFNYKYDQLIVNNGNRITVFAGSYTTDIAIKPNTNG